MKPPEPWHELLRAPRPCDHVIQLYTDEAFLIDAVTRFVGSGFTGGEAAVIIATPAHVEAFTRQLTVRDLDVAGRLTRGQLMLQDAESCLAEFMIGDMPDRAAFGATVNVLFRRVSDAGYEGIRVFGEMVNLLWQHNLPATVQLERLWSEVVARERLTLLCAYGLDNFDHSAHRGVLHQLASAHSHLIPVADYRRLEQAVDRACLDVFGPHGEDHKLRERLGARHVSGVAMPSAQRTLFALHELDARIGAAAIERARVYYYSDRTPSGEGRPVLTR